jgi:hypothetical protein
MSGLGQDFGQATHPGEDREDLLGVVDDVIGLRADLHQDVSHRRILLGEPGMLRVQLVAKDETDGVCHILKGGLRGRLANILA